MKKISNKIKFLVLSGLVGAGSFLNAADVAFDDATKKFTGSLDLTSFYSAAVVVIGALGAIAAVKIGIKMFKGI